MAIDKSLISGTTAMLVLKLLEEKDMYGYEMIESLARKSDRTFNLKAGTLYPLLHSLEEKGCVTSYDMQADNERVRKYYRITSNGKKQLRQKREEWSEYTLKVNKVLGGGEGYAVSL